MKYFFRDSTGTTITPQGSIVGIGSFDGVHLGHRALLTQVSNRAKTLHVKSAALSFDPLPRQFFQGKNKIARLSSPRQRMQELFSFVDCLAVLRFTQRLANTSAEDFIVQTLVNRLRAIEIWVGPDFHFGHARKGNIDLLKALGKQYHFAAHTIEPVQTDEERVSSSRIRIALAQDDFAAAARLLGRPYSIEGHVVRGQQLGRKLGFPTANLRIPWGLAPITGIFAVHVSSRNLTHWPAVASLGTRPTVQGKEPILEAHLFDFDDDLYGQIISITFIAKLREEKYFNSLDELSQQMRHDADLARDILARALKKIDLGNTQS